MWPYMLFGGYTDDDGKIIAHGGWADLMGSYSTPMECLVAVRDSEVDWYHVVLNGRMIDLIEATS